MQLGNDGTERLHVTFVDQSYRYVSDQIMANGRLSMVAVESTDLIYRASELRASGIFLAHNHPSGAARPSAADIRSTEILIAKARQRNLIIHDHLIVADGRFFSLRRGALL